MNIRTVIKVINTMKDEGAIEHYAIGGAVGATFYLEPFSTLDVDIFITFKSAENSLILSPAPVFDYLREAGFEMEGEYFLIGGWPVQFLPPHSPLVDEALAKATSLQVDDAPVSVMTAEHLASIALELGRPKDKARLLQFLDEGALDMTLFEGILTRYQLTQKWLTFQSQFLSDQ